MSVRTFGNDGQLHQVGRIVFVVKVDQQLDQLIVLGQRCQIAHFEFAKVVSWIASQLPDSIESGKIIGDYVLEFMLNGLQLKFYFAFNEKWFHEEL